MDEQVRNQHIGLYVNNFSVDFGKKGRKAIEQMYSIATEHKIIPKPLKDIFIL